MTATAPNLSAADLFDLEKAPFGVFAPSERFRSIRATMISPAGPKFVRQWKYKIFSHFTKAPGRVFDIEYHGLKMRLVPSKASGDRWILRKGRHPEEHDFVLFEPFRGQDAVFVDIGANVGMYTMVARQTLGPGARVVAIEPHPENRMKFTFHLTLNGLMDGVTLVPAAVGEKEGVLKLYVVTDRDEGSHSLIPPRGDASAPAVETPVRLLLDIVTEAGLERIDILKIDVEGFEDQALMPFFDSAPQSLWPQDILIEVLFAKRWKRDCVAELQALGYRPFEETHGNLKLTRRPVA